MIVVEQLRKSFGATQAVDGVSFTARDGQITALLGANGAGKTTTLRMLYTLMRPDAGRILVDGIDAQQDALAVRRVLGVLPDARGLYRRLTARENIEYYAALQGLPPARARVRIDELLQTLSMQDIAGRRTEGFSQGERLKTALARTLIHDPRNVLLDEPTNGLDVMSTRSLREFLRRLRDEGRCVLFSTHIMQEVAALCDHVVIIARGRVVADGTPDALREQAGETSLEEAFMKLIGVAALGELS
ncbi:MAG TPA: ATP-binding cassette domain-containing protein [Steroidobacteraceae bacterium]|jgi:sodium transport system ATP-binding protein|nr:ATP-binding cassette domain-containing protein [Steroidobacteraceae bacterium]